MKAIRLIFSLVSLAMLSACVTVSEPATELPPLGQLLLRSGDQIAVTVLGQPDLSGTYTIDEIGAISMPLVGSVGAAGLHYPRLGERHRQRPSATLIFAIRM